MAQAMRRLVDDMRLVSVVVEVVDARLPRSGRNPELAAMTARKPRLIVLEREDLADPNATAAWLGYFRAHQQPAVAMNGKSRGSAVGLREALASLAPARRQA